MYQQIRSSWLVIDVVDSNMATKKCKQISVIQKWVLKKLPMIKKKQSSMAYEDSVNKQRKEWSAEGTL